MPTGSNAAKTSGNLSRLILGRSVRHASQPYLYSYNDSEHNNGGN
jgi:hypothetical protein